MNFETIELHPALHAGIRAAKYQEPTPIQARAIPKALKGRDLLGIAQTGTGKTAAFAIPVLEKLMEGPRRRVRALVVAPTRELADQITESFRTLGAKTRLRVVTIYGGVSMQPQIRGLRQGAEIVVACPGRLLDHINRRTIDLSGVEFLVLDEADRMFDMGFLPDLRKIVARLPVARQNLLFSATMPDEVRKLADEVLVKPETVRIAAKTMADTVEHSIFKVAQTDKTALLLQVLEHTDTDSVLVFTRTKHRAKRIADQLARKGYKAASLQGDMTQNKRQAALKGFRNGAYQVMVATDIAARGIDVSTISHVINYDMPATVEDYCHRTGRTGRAERSGDALSFVTPEDGAILRSIERTMDNTIKCCELTSEQGHTVVEESKPFADAARPHVAAPAKRKPTNGGGRNTKPFNKSFKKPYAKRSEGRGDGAAPAGRSEGRREGAAGAGQERKTRTAEAGKGRNAGADRWKDRSGARGNGRDNGRANERGNGRRNERGGRGGNSAAA